MKQFITPIILLILAAGIFFWYTSPNYQNAKLVDATVSGLRQTAQAAGNLNTLEQKIRNNYNSISSDQITSLNTLLPDNINTIQLITEINAVGAKHGMTVQDISLTSQDNSGSGAPNANLGASSGAVITNQQTTYGTLPFSFSVTTSYPNFLAFLQDLERSLQLFDITSISVGSVTDKNDTYTYKVSLQTYWLK